MDHPGPSGMGNDKFRHQKNVERQEGIRSERDIFMFDVCNKAFHYKKSLKRHISIHSEERPYACVECNKSFKRSGQLKVHQQILLWVDGGGKLLL